MPSRSRTMVVQAERRLGRFTERLLNAPHELVDSTVQWAWLALLAFGVLSFGAVEPWSLATFEIGSGVVFLWWVVAGMHRGHLTVCLPAILLPGVAFLAFIGFQVIARTTVYPFATKNQFFLFGTYALLVFVAAQVLNSDQSFRRFGISVCGFGLVVSTLAIAQALTAPGEIFWMISPKFGDGVFGTYVNHSHYAGLMEMLVPFPFVFGRSRTLPRRYRGFAFTTGAIMVASVFMAASRGGIIAILLQLCILYLWIFRPSNEGRSARKGWTSIASVVAVAALSIFLGGQEMLLRMSSLKDPYGSTVGATRIAIARDCLHMIGRHPFLGWGAGTFQEAYPAFRSFSTNLIVNAAHNDYLQLLVEFGLVGAAITLWFLVTAYSRARVLRRNWTDSWPHAVSLAALIGTMGILVHSFTDFNLQIPANAGIFFVMCAVASLQPAEPVVAPEAK